MVGSAPEKERPRLSQRQMKRRQPRSGIRAEPFKMGNEAEARRSRRFLPFFVFFIFLFSSLFCFSAVGNLRKSREGPNVEPIVFFWFLVFVFVYVS